MSERRRLEPDVFALPVERMREGYYTDAYFNFSKRVLETRDEHPRVLMQVFQKYETAVLGGMDEAIAALRQCSGRHVGDGARRTWIDGWDELEVRALYDGDDIEPWETVMTIEGDYSLFAHLETVYLGVLTRRTLISTNVRRVVDAAGDKPILFFPARFDHYRVQAGDGWAAHIAGAIGVSTDEQASWWGGKGGGTVPHGLIAAYGGDTVAASARVCRHPAPRRQRGRAGRLRQRLRSDVARLRPRPRRAPVGRAPRHLRDHGRPLACGTAWGSFARPASIPSSCATSAAPSTPRASTTCASW